MPIKSVRKTFNFTFKTSAKNADAIERGIASHAAFIEANHSLALTNMQMGRVYTSKAEGIKTPSQPCQAAMGDLLYTSHEVCSQKGRYWPAFECTLKWEGIGAFRELVGPYDEVLAANGALPYHI